MQVLDRTSEQSVRPLDLPHSIPHNTLGGFHPKDSEVRGGPLMPREGFKDTTELWFTMSLTNILKCQVQFDCSQLLTAYLLLYYKYIQIK